MCSYDPGVLSEESLTRKFGSLWPHLDERQRRLVAAAEARELGRGGIAAGCGCGSSSSPASPTRSALPSASATSPRHVEVEPHRAPSVLGDLEELAGQRLTSHQVIVDLIGSTTTRSGLSVRAELDQGSSIRPERPRITTR